MGTVVYLPEEIAAAQAAHEANRAYCQLIGDDSQPHWEDAPGWQRESALAGVSVIQAHPAITAAVLHGQWLTRKQSEGWVYGATKDAEKKTHPCMVPYDELPASQRVKDDIFGAVVRAMLRAVGVIE